MGCVPVRHFGEWSLSCNRSLIVACGRGLDVAGSDLETYVSDRVAAQLRGARIFSSL